MPFYKSFFSRKTQTAAFFLHSDAEMRMTGANASHISENSWQQLPCREPEQHGLHPQICFIPSSFGVPDRIPTSKATLLTCWHRGFPKPQQTCLRLAARLTRGQEPTHLPGDATGLSLSTKSLARLPTHTHTRTKSHAASKETRGPCLDTSV